MKYDEVMEKLEVTPEMRARILQNVETQMTEPRKKPNRLRRFAALAACLAVLLVGAVALPKLISSPAPEGSETTIANAARFCGNIANILERRTYGQKPRL